MIALLVILAAGAGFAAGVMARSASAAARTALDGERRKAFRALDQTTRALGEAERALRKIARGDVMSPDLLAQSSLDAVDGIRYNDTKDDK